MAGWKVLLFVAFGRVYLGLALVTIIFPTTLAAEEGKWLWRAGLFFATLRMGTLLTLFLRSQDRNHTYPLARRAPSRASGRRRAGQGMGQPCGSGDRRLELATLTQPGWSRRIAMVTSAASVSLPT